MNKKISILLIIAAMTTGINATEIRTGSNTIEIKKINNTKAIDIDLSGIENGVMEQERKKYLNKRLNKERQKREVKERYKKRNKARFKREAINKVKLNYLEKINKIEQCVLLSNAAEDLELCNRRIHNLSKDIGKIERKIKKRGSIRSNIE